VGRKNCWRFPLGILSCLTLGFFSGGPSVATAASPVWAIHGDHNTVYLAGSVHLLKAGESTLPSAFNRAYSDSRSIVMELDMGKVDPMEAASWMLEHGTLPEGSDLHKVIGDDRYRRVSAEAQRLGLPMENANQFAPWVLGLQLMELQYAKLGFDSQAGVEEQLTHRAQADSKPTGGLETLPEQLSLFEALTPSEQMKFLDLVVTDLKDTSDDTQSVIAAWRTGDASKLAALLSDEYKQFPTLYRALVTDRNKRWVPQIEKLLKEKNNYFVVVGALHLVGDGGLLDLMRRDGFKAEQLN
jgi:uncharacterized protein